MWGVGREEDVKMCRQSLDNALRSFAVQGNKNRRRRKRGDIKKVVCF